MAMELNRRGMRSARGGKWLRSFVADAGWSMFAARVCFTGHTNLTNGQAEAASANGISDHVGRSFSPLGLWGILVFDLRNGVSGLAKSDQHSLGEMNTLFVTFRHWVPRRAVPRTGMVNESGFDGACYDDKGVFGHLGLPLLSTKHITLLAGTLAQRHHAQAS
jgi:hypothetical protein